jgi:hypothetical protein
MLQKADQPSEARAVAFLRCKKRRLVATVLRFLHNEMKQNKPFWRWFFWYFFATEKVQEINF